MRISLMLLISMGSLCFGQLRSITAYGSYLSALGKQRGFTELKGFGGGAVGTIPLGESFSLNISFGFERYGSISQDSSLAKWNWKFWNERYSGNVRIDTVADTLDAILNPVQSMEVLPLLVTLSLELNPSERFSIRQSVGGGIMFYTRSLYLSEQWIKRFKSQDYTFEYDFRNFAPDKKGNPLVVVGVLEFSYRVSDAVALTAISRYASVVRTQGSMGYDEFPLRDAVSLSLGLSFLY